MMDRRVKHIYKLMLIHIYECDSNLGLAKGYIDKLIRKEPDRETLLTFVDMDSK